ALGFYQEAPFYYGPGFHEPGSSLAVGLNRRVWDDMNPTEQAIVRAACREVNDLSLGEFTYQNARYLNILKTEHGTQLRRFSPEIMGRVNEISRDVRSDAGSGGELERRIYESFETALVSMRGWATISDGAYYTAREAKAL
ncbi:MAG: ABC transporter substrate-binding protein, partial [Pseudomonadota bacterium]